MPGAWCFWDVGSILSHDSDEAARKSLSHHYGEAAAIVKMRTGMSYVWGGEHGRRGSRQRQEATEAKI